MNKPITIDLTPEECAIIAWRLETLAEEQGVCEASKRVLQLAARIREAMKGSA